MIDASPEVNNYQIKCKQTSYLLLTSKHVLTEIQVMVKKNHSSRDNKIPGPEN